MPRRHPRRPAERADRQAPRDTEPPPAARPSEQGGRGRDGEHPRHGATRPLV